MSVRDVMSKDVDFVEKNTSILDAAKKMRAQQYGFLPIADSSKNKLCGVVTDRDITIRAVAECINPSVVTVSEILSDRVLYCFEDDSIETAANSMRDQCVYRLVVLNNKHDKKLVGIISLGDVVRNGLNATASSAAEHILAN